MPVFCFVAQASRLQDPIEPPPLAYRKWRLVGQENIYDIVNCGMFILVCETNIDIEVLCKVFSMVMS